MIITVTNQKGGIGKSTTSHALGAYYAMNGKKVLLVDLDAQSNLTLASDAKMQEISIADVLANKIDINESIQKVGENLYMIASDNRLSDISAKLPKIGRYDVLKKKFDSIKGKYDMIVIDTPPALGDITLNAYMASDTIIIPAQADVFSLRAIKELHETVEAVKDYNEKLKIAGILLTRYQQRSILTRDMTELIEEYAEEIGTKVFKSKIRESVLIKEAQALHIDIFSYSERSKVAQDYVEFIKEFERG